MSESDGLVAEVGSGDRRRALEALRDRLAVEVERVAEDGYCTHCRRGSSSVAPLSRQLADVLKQLDGLADDEAEADGVDDLAARRAARRADAAGAVGS